MCKEKTKIHIIATGGTIAGAGKQGSEVQYVPGIFNFDDILASVPEIQDIANISYEQMFNIASQDFEIQHWLLLAERINELLIHQDIDGIVITHGTDTMEETAYFLNLVIRSPKPVVLTGSMRPSTARSADGPGNLFNAVMLASNTSAKKRGVLVTVNEKIFSAHDVGKFATTHIDAFLAPNYGPLGYICDGNVQFCRSTERLHTISSEFAEKLPNKLPTVVILSGYVDCPPEIVDYCLQIKAKGIVFAGTGNGNIPKKLLNKLSLLQKKGVIIVRAARACYGATLSGEMNDEKLNTVPADILSPQKAKILLQLALTKTKDLNKIRNYFKIY